MSDEVDSSVGRFLEAKTKSPSAWLIDCGSGNASPVFYDCLFYQGADNAAIGFVKKPNDV
jgi:hypothetical protein